VEKRGVTPLILNLDTKLKLRVNSMHAPAALCYGKSHRRPQNRELDGFPKPEKVKGSENKEQALSLMLLDIQIYQLSELQCIQRNVLLIVYCE
jgi:hypothetical protein